MEEQGAPDGPNIEGMPGEAPIPDSAPSPNPAPSPNSPPGWYPSGPNAQAYWDGTQWTGHTAPGSQPPGTQPPSSPSDDRTMALLAHLSAFVAGFLGPLVIFLIKKDESAFVRHHAVEALNFQITVMIALFISFILLFVLVGILLLPLVFIGAIVLQIMAAIAANKGEWYRYPVSIRLIK